MDDEIIVTLTLDDGSELDCEIYAIYEAGGRDYIALVPIDSDSEEVFFYRYIEDEDGNPSLENIEDDDEYEIALDAFDEILDDEEFAETFGDDEE
ncbi:MAG: DUF1292 domain-containing protein [Lachnospiraceae bacterium]|nr:DUF1292 domain-containing protein [Lachnospiraceae bacterium]